MSDTHSSTTVLTPFILIHAHDKNKNYSFAPFASLAICLLTGLGTMKNHQSERLESGSSQKQLIFDEQVRLW